MCTTWIARTIIAQATPRSEPLLPLGLEGAREKWSLGPDRAAVCRGHLIGTVAIRGGVQPIQGALAGRELKK